MKKTYFDTIKKKIIVMDRKDATHLVRTRTLIPFQIAVKNGLIKSNIPPTEIIDGMSKLKKIKIIKKKSKNRRGK